MLLSKDFYQLTGLAGGIFALKEDKNPSGTVLFPMMKKQYYCRFSVGGIHLTGTRILPDIK